eukprot:TRINITY_DN39520_c0_g1_i1.p1 TRINITY_DN39520_c0_g1~~TRINITY_DN39520_c0_g1_i1.p1  ORF type:complete len:463 (+),score=89.34 TRINITY_DN39520_c0_g1_i1:53-1441(+)
MTEDPAQTVFEPTGELFKDYCAYCEIEDRDERDDVLDSITLCDVKESPRNAQTPHNVHTKLFLRGLESPLHKRDMSALSNAIPHCRNLYCAKFFGCSLSAESWKILVAAVHRSASLITVAVDFNGSPLGKDSTIGPRGPKPVYLSKTASQRSITQPPANAKKPAEEKHEEPEAELVKVPDGWHALLLTNLQEISLRGNQINDKQVKLIAGLLETSKELLSLNLWGNCVRDEGAGYLAAALRCNHHLTALNLGNNRITDDGLLTLSEAFKQADLNPTDLKEVRDKVLTYFPGMSAETPVYPTYAEALAGSGEVKEVKKPPPKGKGKEQGAGGALPTSPWDKNCVKISNEMVRTPGNTVLWSLNIGNNRDITTKGVRTVISMMEPVRPPVSTTPEDSVLERKKSAVSTEDPPLIPPPAVQGIALNRFIIANSNLPKDLCAALDEVLAKHQAPQVPSGDGEVGAT